MYGSDDPAHPIRFWTLTIVEVMRQWEFLESNNITLRILIMRPS